MAYAPTACAGIDSGARTGSEGWAHRPLRDSIRSYVSPRMLPKARLAPVLILLLALAGDFPARAQPAEPDLAGTWSGQAVLTNDWPGFTCRYEGAESPPAVQLELTKDGGQWTGSVAIDVAPAEGSGCPPLRKRYAISAIHAGDGSVSFTDSGGNEWNLALRHGEGLLKGLMAWKTGDESLASGFKATSGATPLTRLSGEVKLQRAEGDSQAPTEGPKKKVTAGQRVGHIGAILAANVVAGGVLYGVNKAGKSTTGGGAVTCSPRNCVITAVGQPCDCPQGNIVSGAPCGSTTSGVALLGVCDGTSLPCQSGFSCNRGFCEDRSGACPF